MNQQADPLPTEAALPAEVKEPQRQRIPKVLIAGFGFGGLYAYRELAPLAAKGAIRLQVVSAETNFMYTPLLHEFVGGILDRECVFVPVKDLINPSFTELHIDRLHSLDLNEKLLFGAEGKYNYDHLILALGSEVNHFDVKGAQENSVGFKSRSDAQELKGLIHNDLERSEPKLKNIVVVGAGPDGVKIATTLRQFFNKFARRDVKISIVDRTAQPLSNYLPAVSSYAQKKLAQQSVELLLSRRVEKVGSNYVELIGEEELPSDLTIWCAGVKPLSINVRGEVTRANSGRWQLDRWLRLPRYSEVLVVGDLGESAPGEAMLAQVAKAKGKFAGKLIAQLSSGKIATAEHSPAYVYNVLGKLINFGSWSAAFDLNSFALTGPLALIAWRAIYLREATSWKHTLMIFFNWLKSFTK